MTKEYLKMADVFPSGVFADHDSYEFNGWSILIDANGSLIDESGDGGFERDTASAIAHAINSHDELVAEVERLRSMIDALEKEHENIIANMLDKASALGVNI